MCFINSDDPNWIFVGLTQLVSIFARHRVSPNHDSGDHKQLSTVHFQPFFYPLLMFRCLAVWRLCPETTTGWLGPWSPGLRGEKRRLLDFFSASFHTSAHIHYNSGKAWKITAKTSFFFATTNFTAFFLVLNKSFKPKNITNFTESSVHRIRHCCWRLLSWLARIPRAVVLGLFDLNCDWHRIPTSQNRRRYFRQN